MVRTSIIIDGKRLSDYEFTHVNLAQAIGVHHFFEIRLRQDPKRGILNTQAKSWIGKQLSIGFENTSDQDLMQGMLPDKFKGIVTSVGLSRQRGTGELIIRGHSPSVATDDGTNTRSFTDKTLQEIVNDVLGPYNSKFPSGPKIEPQRFKGSIPYLVQYKESNFEFITRIANFYGEWIYYDGLNFFFGMPAGGKAIVLDFGENGLTYFDISAKALPIKFKLQGYDYNDHKNPLKEEAALTAKSSSLGKDIVGIATGQLYSESPLLPISMAMDKKELKHLGGRREEVAVDEVIVIQGASRNPALSIGGKIEIKDTTLGENYGTFVITNLTHDIGQAGDYINHFEAIPEEVETAPLTKIPDSPSCEAQLAKVTDVNDDKSLGRVKVKFQWQEGTQEQTPWIRVATPYSGKDKGFYIIPEVDDQVLVAFENNNPDKPYVLSSMYNSDAKPEWFDPKNNFKGFKSRGGNKWKFDDKDNAIQIHAPNSILMTAGKTISIRSGKKDDDSSIVMKEGKEITVKTNGKSDSKIFVDAGEGSVTIKAKTITIEATDLIELKSGKDVTADAKSKVKISGTSKVEVESTETKLNGSAKVEATGAQVTIKGSAMVDVKGGLIKLN